MNPRILNLAGKAIEIGEKAIVRNLRGGKTAVLESLGKESHLTIFNQKGEEVMNRLSSVMSENVGNKKVITREIIQRYEKPVILEPAIDCADLIKHSRVYNKNGIQLGGRIEHQRASSTFEYSDPIAKLNYGDRQVIKYTGNKPFSYHNDNFRYSDTHFKDGIRVRKYIATSSWNSSTRCNDQGLPLPPCEFLRLNCDNVLEKMKGMSMHQMYEELEKTILKFYKYIGRGFGSGGFASNRLVDEVNTVRKFKGLKPLETLPEHITTKSNGEKVFDFLNADLTKYLNFVS